MVELAANTNSVTISTGIRLDAFFSISLRRAPSRDYRFIRKVECNLGGKVHFKCWTPIVHIWLQPSVITKVQFVLEILHPGAATAWLTWVKQSMVVRASRRCVHAGLEVPNECDG
jgi:hypothetical protein